MSSTAAKLIEKYGRKITVERRISTTDFDAARPWAGKESSTQKWTTKAVFKDPRNAEDNRDYSERVEIRTNLRRADYHVFLAPDGLPEGLRVDDYILDVDGNRYMVVTCSPVKPGEEVMLYIAQVVRG